MQALLNFLGIGEKKISKKIHSYKKVITEKGAYTKREDGLEFFISSDLLN